VERCIAAGYDNGDLKIFDLKQNRLITDENVKNGICGMEFDRKDIKMNKLVVTGLEGRFYLYDLRTYHPVKGFSSMSRKTTGSTIWGARHTPFNRDIFVTLGGDGNLSLYKYNYPKQRVIQDAEGRDEGVMGTIELLND
jgi:WD40 repeat protein